jgi:hypothetical protein
MGEKHERADVKQIELHKRASVGLPLRVVDFVAALVEAGLAYLATVPWLHYLATAARSRSYYRKRWRRGQPVVKA